MKKRIALILLALAFSLVLSGCCLKHNWAPATCTEPETCEKCGKTRGEALGHDWQEACCTEPETCVRCGETRGEALGHEWQDASCTEPETCTRCGETRGEALGHEWKEATFFEPKTCQRCGEAEGEALEARLFTEALIPEAAPKENTVEETPGEDKAAEKTSTAGILPEGFSKDYLITLNTQGFGIADLFIGMSSAKLTVQAENEDLALAQLQVSIPGMKQIVVLLTVDREGLGLTAPGRDDTYYYMSYEDLKTVLEETAENAEALNMMASPQDSLAEYTELVSADELRELALRYGEIIFGVATKENTTETSGPYTLAGLGETVDCLTVTCKPTEEEWKTMLEKLFSTAKEDEQLLELFARAIRLSSRGSGTIIVNDEEVDAEQFITSLPERIQEQYDKAGEYAASLSGKSFEFALGDGQIHAIKFVDEEGTGFGYESIGELESGRKDAIVSYEDDGADVELLSSLKGGDQEYRGSLYFKEADLNATYYLNAKEEKKPEFNVQITVEGQKIGVQLNTEGEDQVLTVTFGNDSVTVTATSRATESMTLLSVPNTEKTILKTVEDLAQMIENLSSALSG